MTKSNAAAPAKVAKQQMKTKREAAPVPEGRILTLTEASKEWNMPKTAIRNLCRQGKLRPFVGFKEWRFLSTDIFGALERL